MKLLQFTYCFCSTNIYNRIKSSRHDGDLEEQQIDIYHPVLNNNAKNILCVPKGSQAMGEDNYWTFSI